jgi:hypothetical protein
MFRIWSLFNRAVRNNNSRRSPRGSRKFSTNCPRFRQPSVEPLESRLAPSAVSWTGGAGDFSWSDKGNWSNNATPTSADDVTISISVSNTINIGGGAYAVNTLNDTSASLNIASTGSLSLAAVSATSTLGQNVTIQPGGSLTVGAGASVVVGPAQFNAQTVTLTDNGTVSFAAHDIVILSATGNASTAQIVVGSGGELIANGTTFNAAPNSQTTQVVLNIGVVVKAGDFVGDAFNVPLYIPAVDVQYLSGSADTNLSFQNIYIQPDTLTAGENVTITASGQNTTKLLYLFPANFTVNQLASLTFAPNLSIVIGPAQFNAQTVTLTDNGTVSFAADDTVTLSATGNASTAQIVVNSGGELSASSTIFNAAPNSQTTQIVLNVGAVVKAGDFVGNAFNVSLYIPVIDVQYLSGSADTNLSFQNIYIQPDTLTAGENVTINASGQNTTSLLYIFPGNFTVNPQASLSFAPNLSIVIGPALFNQQTVTLTDNGTVSFAADDLVTLTATGNASTAQIVVGSGGELSASGTIFNAANSIQTMQIVLNIGAVVKAGDFVGNVFNVSLYIPAIDVQYLSGSADTNVSFQNIYIQPDTLTAGENVAINASGTNTTKLLYIFPGNFTVSAQATLTFAPNLSILIGPALFNQQVVTLADNGTLGFAADDTVTISATGNSSTAQIVVGSGGELSATGAIFNAANAIQTMQIVLDIGAVVKTGDFVGNIFNLSLYIPAIDVQYLSGSADTNVSFQDIYIQPDTLTAGENVAINAVGQRTANLMYILPGNFTVNPLATLSFAPNLSILIGPAPFNQSTVTLADNAP